MSLTKFKNDEMINIGESYGYEKGRSVYVCIGTTSECLLGGDSRYIDKNGNAATSCRDGSFYYKDVKEAMKALQRYLDNVAKSE